MQVWNYITTEFICRFRYKCAEPHKLIIYTLWWNKLKFKCTICKWKDKKRCNIGNGSRSRPFVWTWPNDQIMAAQPPSLNSLRTPNLHGLSFECWLSLKQGILKASQPSEQRRAVPSDIRSVFIYQTSPKGVIVESCRALQVLLISALKANFLFRDNLS